jgi:hypothetical protein
LSQDVAVAGEPIRKQRDGLVVPYICLNVRRHFLYSFGLAPLPQKLTSPFGEQVVARKDRPTRAIVRFHVINRFDLWQVGDRMPKRQAEQKVRVFQPHQTCTKTTNVLHCRFIDEHGRTIARLLDKALPEEVDK